MSDDVRIPGNAESVSLPNLRGQRVIVTGGLGFIGSNLVRTCLELGAKVTIYDCLNPRSGGNLYNIHDIKDSVELCYHDIADFDRVCQHITNKDIIFNCAASTSHPFSMREPWLDLDVNSRAVIDLLEAARRFNRDIRFIHLGTTTQLGRLQYRPADEQHPEFPTDIYSANKSVSEKYVLIYAKAYKLRATAIRLPNVFGPRACIHSPEFTFNNFFIGLALQNKEITVFGDGKQMRNVIYVDDVVSSLISASQADNMVAETFFAVGDEHFSVAEIAEATVKYIGSGSVRYVPWPAGREAVDVGDAIISNQKLKKTIGWQPAVDLETGFIKTRQYFENCLFEYLK